MDYFAVAAFLRQFAAHFDVRFYYFEFEVFAGEVYQAYGHFRRTHNEYLADAVHVFAAHPGQFVHELSGGGEVEYVAFEHAVVAAGYDGFVVSLDGRNVEVAVAVGEILQVHAHQGCSLAEFDSCEDNLSVVQLEPVPCP